MKLKPILLGVSSKGILRVDPKTKEVLDMWDYQVLKNWAYSRKTFVLVSVGRGGRGEGKGVEEFVVHMWENLCAGECEGEEVRGEEMNQRGKRGGSEEEVYVYVFVCAWIWCVCVCMCCMCGGREVCTCVLCVRGGGCCSYWNKASYQCLLPWQPHLHWCHMQKPTDEFLVSAVEEEEI